MAAALKKRPKFDAYVWEGVDKQGKKAKGEMEAASVAYVNSTLRRQGISPVKVNKRRSNFFKAARKKRKLETAGWRVGSAAEFLELSPEESSLIDLKLSMGQLVRKMRARAHLSQHELAERLRSSQSRVAKMEAGDAGFRST